MIIDPTEGVSGLSSWADSLLQVLKPLRPVSCKIVKRRHGESGQAFQRKVSHLVERKAKNRLLVITPETRQSTEYVRQNSSLLVVTVYHGGLHTIPYLSGMRNVTEPRKMDSHFIRRQVMTAGNSDVRVSPSEMHWENQVAVEKSLLGFSSGLDYLVPNPMIHKTPQPFVPMDERLFDLCFVGRADTLKGFDVVLKIISEDKSKKWALVVPSVPDFLQLGEKVSVFQGLSATKANKILANSRYFVDFSRYHNYSTVLAEAMTRGTPGALRQINTYDDVLRNYNLPHRFVQFTDDTLLNPEKIMSEIQVHQRSLADSNEDLVQAATHYSELVNAANVEFFGRLMNLSWPIEKGEYEGSAP